MPVPFIILLLSFFAYPCNNFFNNHRARWANDTPASFKSSVVCCCSTIHDDLDGEAGQGEVNILAFFCSLLEYRITRLKSRNLLSFPQRCVYLVNAEERNPCLFSDPNADSKCRVHESISRLVGEPSITFDMVAGKGSMAHLSFPCR